MNNYLLDMGTKLLNLIVSSGWTHKIQITQSDIYSTYLHRLVCAQVLLSSASMTGITSVIFFNNEVMKILSAILSFLLLVVNLFLNKNSYGQKIIKTKNDANNFLSIKDSALNLFIDLVYKRQTNIKSLNNKYKDLIKMYKAYNVNLLNSSNKAVNLASNKLKNRSDDKYDDDYRYFVPSKVLNLFKKMECNQK